MNELWLNFRDESGANQRILVEKDEFTIGRTSQNDLTIPLANLSREHARIERLENGFTISDSGSSNGTTLNNVPLTEALILRDGDQLDLGGGCEISVEFIPVGKNTKGASAESAVDDVENSSSSLAAAPDGSGAGAAADEGLNFKFLFILAGALSIFILIGIGVIVMVSGGGDKKPDISRKGSGSGPSSFDEEELPKNRKSATPTPDGTTKPSSTATPDSTPRDGDSTSTPTPGGSSTPVVPDPTQSTKPANSDELEKVRTTSGSFLRGIAKNDPKAFLTVKQTNIVNDKIKTVKNWSVLADNLKDAKRSGAKIQELARARNLSPQFLLVAALTELGNQKGNVLDKSNEIIGVLTDLGKVLDDGHADDNLLIVAAFDQGKAGQFLKMRDLLSSLSGKSSSSSMAVRSIWFLNENQKISNEQYDRALRFLAIGTIAQNPKDFGVNAEPVIF